MIKYTKSQLEQIVINQLDNLNALQDLIRLLNEQNQLLEKANNKLNVEIDRLEKKHAVYVARKKGK